AVELLDQVGRHRLAQVGASVKQRDQGAAPREPHGRLAGRVASADDRDALRGTDLPLEWPGGVEDAETLVLLEPLYGKAPVFGARGEQHRSCGDFFSVFELDHVPLGARFQRFGAVGARDPRVELARLRRGAADEFGAADARGEAEVVLDPARRSRLPADGGALEYQGLEPL